MVKVIAVDIPIGLLEEAMPGGRVCDQEARRLLGQPRARSVFSPPVRAALRYENDYQKALGENRKSSSHYVGISKQAHSLFQKISEANALPEEQLNTRIYEVHPEVCFFQMNDCKPLQHSKKAKQEAGIKERRAVLERTGFKTFVSEILDRRPPGVSKDDALDALAACWTAVRISEGRQLPRDKGGSHAIWR
jgi:predicted RNase H-like nuclease